MDTTTRKNQIFRTTPSSELVERIVRAFGLKGIQDRNQFCRKDMTIHQTLKKITDMVPELEAVYLPCKSRTYLHGITEKNVTTILRHFLKTQGYTIDSQEKYMKGVKYIMYRIVPYIKGFSEDEDDKSVGSGTHPVESPITIVKQPVKIEFK